MMPSLVSTNSTPILRNSSSCLEILGGCSMPCSRVLHSAASSEMPSSARGPRDTWISSSGPQPAPAHPTRALPRRRPRGDQAARRWRRGAACAPRPGSNASSASKWPRPTCVRRADIAELGLLLQGGQRGAAEHVAAAPPGRPAERGAARGPGSATSGRAAAALAHGRHAAAGVVPIGNAGSDVGRLCGARARAVVQRSVRPGGHGGAGEQRRGEVMRACSLAPPAGTPGLAPACLPPVSSAVSAASRSASLAPANCSSRFAAAVPRWWWWGWGCDACIASTAPSTVQRRPNEPDDRNPASRSRQDLGWVRAGAVRAVGAVQVAGARAGAPKRLVWPASRRRGQLPVCAQPGGHRATGGITAWPAQQSTHHHHRHRRAALRATSRCGVPRGCQRPGPGHAEPREMEGPGPGWAVGRSLLPAQPASLARGRQLAGQVGAPLPCPTTQGTTQPQLVGWQLH
jgi:hypothetical protein